MPERAEGVEPGWPHGPWATPASLRRRFADEQVEVEGQMVLSGRWRSITDPYWDTCVIEVPWRIAVGSVISRTDEATPSVDVGPD